MTRDEHLAWCKRRALEYVDAGDVQGAITSMTSDLSKHAGTKTIAPEIMALGFAAMLANDREQARRFINGFK
jgi:hypothetical protein